MTVRSPTATYDPRDAEQRAELIRALDAARERLQGARRRATFTVGGQLTLIGGSAENTNGRPPAAEGA